MPAPNPKEEKKISTEPKTETETVSKADFDALQERYNALETDSTEKLTNALGVTEELRTRLSALEEDKRAVEKNEIASTIAEIMTGLDEDSRTSLENALKAGDGGSIVGNITKHITETKLTPLQAQLEQKDNDLKARDAMIDKLMIVSPAKSAAAIHFRDHPTAQEIGVMKLTSMMKRDGDKLVPNDKAPFGGVDPESGDPFTMDSLGAYLASSDTLLGKGSSISLAGGDGEDTKGASSRDAAYKSAKKSGDWDSVMDSMIDELAPEAT